MSKLDGAKILTLIPPFFGYDDLINNEYSKIGAIVYSFNERSIKSPLSIAISKVFPFLFAVQSFYYHQKIIRKTSGINFDYILIVKGDMMSRRVLKMYKKKFPNAKLCLYLWDSLKNSRGIISKIHLFDLVSSFDKTDAGNRYSINFLTLFAPSQVPPTLFQKNKTTLYDVSFCGTIHSDRMRILSALEHQFKDCGLIYKHCYYLPAKFMYFFYSIFKSGFRNRSINDFFYKKLASTEVSDINSNSRAIIDIHHPKQNGLTMRLIEAVTNNIKVATTNDSVLNYDFYKPENIYIINRTKPCIPKSFFETDYVKVDKSILLKYSLNRWIYQVLGTQCEE